MTELPPEFVYQGFIRQKIVALMRTIVASVPGSGKTRPVVEALVELKRIFPQGAGVYKFPYGPILVVCTGPAIATWVRQLPQWSNTPELAEEIHIVSGRPKHKRIQLWEQARTLRRGIYIINFSIFLRDYALIKAISWGAVVADEYHKCMRRKKKNRTYAAFLSMTRHIEVLILITGSLMRKNPASMFTSFQLIQPGLYRSYWKFVNTFCYVIDGPFGQIIEGVKNVEALQEVIDRYMAYVPKEVTAEQLPDGRRMPLHALMTKEQTKIYDDLSQSMIAEIGDSLLVTPNVLTMIIRLRQLLCCPRILDPSLGMGGGYELILDRLEETPHAVIFVPFRPACDFILSDLEQRGYQNVHMIRGGIGYLKQQYEVDCFKAHKGILICTISYAESFDLETCDTSYFLGYDYSADVNEQAEGRTRRAISKYDFVTWNYIKYSGTIDEDFLGQIDIDMRNVSKVMRRPQSLINALKGVPQNV